MPKQHARRSRSTPIRRRVRANTSSMSRLPQIQAVPTIHTVCRYVNRASVSTTGTQAVTTINLINSLGCLATGANTCYPIHGFFRVVRVRVWSGVNAVTSFNQAPTIGVRWFNTVAGTLGDTNYQVSDSSISTAAPAFVDSRPPTGSAASWWSGPSTNTLFNIFYAYTTAIFLDLHMEMMINDNANGAVTALTTTNTMTIGNMYWPSLDGVGTNGWVRIGLPNIS